MEYFKIELNGKHFIDSYLVYLIEVRNENYGRYFYIGQTGDRNHFTARPAFRRLAAHLSDQGRSTENQLYRYIANKVLKLSFEKNKVFDVITKRQVSTFLRSSTICMHVFPIKEFDHAQESEHRTNRQYVEAIEQEVIANISNQFGPAAVLNTRLPKVSGKATAEILNSAKLIVQTACP
jgi:hypothetical protein